MTAIRTSALFVLALLLLTVSATAAPRMFDDPMTAAENNFRVQLWVYFMEWQGYELQQVDEVPILYFVQPTGDYDWGDIVYRMMRTHRGSTQVDYCDIAADIMMTDAGCYVTGIHVNEWTVP